MTANPMPRGPCNTTAAAPDQVVESEESVTGSAEQQEEVRSDSEDEDDIMPLPRIVRGDTEQRRAEKRPYSVQSDLPVEALRTYSQAECSTESRARSVAPMPLATESRANSRTRIRVEERTPRSRSPRQRDAGNLTDDAEEGSLFVLWRRDEVSGPGVEVSERSRDRRT
jgi:hypothetical protein